MGGGVGDFGGGGVDARGLEGVWEMWGHQVQ